MRATDIRNFLKEWVRENGYYSEALTVYGDGNPQVIIFGEVHRIEKHREDQLDLTARVGSSHFLHEDFRNLIYNRGTNVLEEKYPIPEKICPFREREVRDEQDKDFLAWQREHDVSVRLHQFDAYWFSQYFIRINKILENLPPAVTHVIGCDLSYAEHKYYEKLYGRRITETINYGVQEQRMAQAILDVLEHAPLIVGLGRAHMREGENEFCSIPSHIHTNLQAQSIRYAYIDQIKHH